jgi:hypothetical protein
MAKSRSKRTGIGCEGACELDDTVLLVRGDIVSYELADGRFVEHPESWGLVHDPVGSCVDPCEIFVCPYTLVSQSRTPLPHHISETAREYWGDGYELKSGSVVIPKGPWDRVGRIVRVYYDRYGELASKYQHPFKDVEGDEAFLYRQKRSQSFGPAGSHKAYRISLPDGCVINAHGFVWP